MLCTARQRKRDVLHYVPLHCEKNGTLHIGIFLPLKNDHLFGTPPPPTDNDRVCDHNAMSASPFPQEKISHNTTAVTTICFK